jgi:hypothetical protein
MIVPLALLSSSRDRIKWKREGAEGNYGVNGRYRREATVMHSTWPLATGRDIVPRCADLSL